MFHLPRRRSQVAGPKLELLRRSGGGGTSIARDIRVTSRGAAQGAATHGCAGVWVVAMRAAQHPLHSPSHTEVHPFHIPSQPPRKM